MLLISSFKSYCLVFLNVHFWNYSILRNFEITIYMYMYFTRLVIHKTRLGSLATIPFLGTLLGNLGTIPFLGTLLGSLGTIPFLGTLVETPHTIPFQGTHLEGLGTRMTPGTEGSQGHHPLHLATGDHHHHDLFHQPQGVLSESSTPLLHNCSSQVPHNSDQMR